MGRDGAGACIVSNDTGFLRIADVSLSTDGTTFTRVGQVQKVTNGSQKSNLADVTNLDSPNAFIERITTTLDSGTLSVTVVANPSDPGQLMLLAGFNAQTRFTCQVQYPPVGTQVKGQLNTFLAFVTSAPQPSLAVTEASTFDAELTITGPVTVTAGS